MPKYSEAFIRNELTKRVLVLDGAMGTMIQREHLTDADYGGKELAGCNEYLVITRPDVVLKIHRAYLEAGADIIETDSFGSTPLVLAEYGLQSRAEELSRKAAELARQAADEFDKQGEERFVAGSMGPTTRAISLTGGVTFEELVESFYIQARGLQEGGVDLFLLETAQDTLNLKASLVAIQKLRQETSVKIPVMVSGTIEPMGAMLAGQGVESLVTSLEYFQPLSFGINCGTGADFMTDHIRTIQKMATSFVSVYPNAGMPDEEGHYHESPEKMGRDVAAFCDEGWVNIVGGCCGTTPDHIHAIKKAVKNKKPHVPRESHGTRVSGIDFLPIEEDGRPYLVGERTNSLGSKKFRELIAEGKHNEAAEIARRQVKNGAHIVDVCLQNSDRDEKEDMEAFLPVLLKKIKVPLMIDSTRTEILELALRHSQGKIIYNSVNLENGEHRFAEVAPLYHKFGFALVVGTIDDNPGQGMGLTVERKLEIAKKSYALLTEKYGIDPTDIIFDPLVFPVGTGDVDYIGSAQATIEGVRAIKKALPQCKTILGLSNVSFGLPTAGREVLNSVFLYHNVQAGMDLAIVNAEKLMRYPSIPEEERRLAEALIFHTKESYAQALADFSNFYKGKKAAEVKPKVDRKSIPLEERLSGAILEATTEGLYEDLDEALKNKTPLEVINGPLMAGMAEVGRLFNGNQLIVAEVLQSAEVMKAAVSHLEKNMEKGDESSRGSFLLATVKGDVHDIGKNLVDIILSNNGYKVINLGIKIPPEEIIAACREHSPDAIGLSGLLVKSAEQMVETAADLKKAGIAVPIFVGGAALSSKFARKKIRPNYDGPIFYAKDAMEGLDLMNRYMNGDHRAELVQFWSESGDEKAENARTASTEESMNKGASTLLAEEQGSTALSPLHPLRYDYGKDGKPEHPVDLKKHRIQLISLEDVFPYINTGMLYKKHLGFRGEMAKAEAEKDPKWLELKEMVEGLQDHALSNGLMRTDAIYRFFRAASDGNDLVILDDDGKVELERFHFKRQSDGDRLCLADYVAPLRSGIEDYVAMFVVTAGVGVREKATLWKDEGKYLVSHGLSALALETAEAYAEYLHKKIRMQWGIAGSDGTTAKELFACKYQGARFSFGYPACPDLSDQAKLFALLAPPEDFGVQLTEGFSMDPEASVSAIVFQHPEARYFGV